MTPTSHPKAAQRHHNARLLARRGWLPDYHGAWAMVIVPFLVGTLLGTPRWEHLPLFLAWLTGYCCFYAATTWWRARRRSPITPALLTYAGLAAVWIIITVVISPRILYWAPWCILLTAMTVVLTLTRHERALLTRVITVIAGCLMGLIAYDMGTGYQRAGSPWWLFPISPQMAALPGHNPGHTVTGWWWAITVMLVLTLYFVGTVPVVKTVFRERRNTGYLVFSVVYHAVVVGMASVSAYYAVTGWALVAVSLLLLARSLYFPLSMRYGSARWRPAIIGITEIMMTLIVTVTCLFLS